jgi:hypothetical protein
MASMPLSLSYLPVTSKHLHLSASLDLQKHAGQPAVGPDFSFCLCRLLAFAKIGIRSLYIQQAGHIHANEEDPIGGQVRYSSPIRRTECIRIDQRTFLKAIRRLPPQLSIVVLYITEYIGYLISIAL